MPIESGQYTSIRYSNRLADASTVASIGSVGDSYDNALAESVIGLYKRECVRHDGPFRTVDELELATLSWVDWFNHDRLHGELGRVTDRVRAENEHPTAVAVGRTQPLRTRGASLVDSRDQ